MRPQLETLGSILPENTVATVTQLVAESTRRTARVSETIQQAVARMEVDGPERTRAVIVEAVAELRTVKRLADEIDEWTFGDHTGFVAEQGRAVVDGVSAVEAEFRRAAIAFAACRSR